MNEAMSTPQLEALGFCPDNIIGSPRIPGQPVKLRSHDDLVERSSSGAISISLGYFSPTQVAWRQYMARQMSAAFEKAFSS